VSAGAEVGRGTRYVQKIPRLHPAVKTGSAGVTLNLSLQISRQVANLVETEEVGTEVSEEIRRRLEELTVLEGLRFRRRRYQSQRASAAKFP
jgi:hypothetical protein